MSRGFARCALAFLLLCVCALSVAAEGRWVTAWSASPQPLWQGDDPPTRVPTLLHDQTLRQVVRTSLGGKRVRVFFSNRHGSTPLTIGAAHAGISAGGASLRRNSGSELRFSGRRAVVIPPGGSVRSDPLPLAVAAQDRIAVSVWLPQRTVPSTFHWEALQTAWVVPGDRVSVPRMLTRHTLRSRLFLAGLEVDNRVSPGAVAAFGDSITDGSATTPNADRRWTDVLAQRLSPQRIAVFNAGIAGDRLLKDGMGSRAAARFGEDVLSRPGVRSVVVLLGINDIGWPGTPLAPQETTPTAAEMIRGYRALIAQARRQQVRILGATLLPFENALSGTPQRGYYTDAKEAVRREVNTWIRNGGEFDAVVDFDLALRDPRRPQRLLPRYDCGDHLHPNDAGHAAMAAAVDTALLLPPRRNLP